MPRSKKNEHTYLVDIVHNYIVDRQNPVLFYKHVTFGNSRTPIRQRRHPHACRAKRKEKINVSNLTLLPRI